VSFGGLLTNVKQKYDSKQFALSDLCYSIQETVFAMLVEITERALAHCQKSQVVLGGGVGCNTRLQEMLGQMCAQRGATVYVPKNEFLVDNAAMIGVAGILAYESGERLDPKDAVIDPYLRTDDVDISWRTEK